MPTGHCCWNIPKAFQNKHFLKRTFLPSFHLPKSAPLASLTNSEIDIILYLVYKSELGSHLVLLPCHHSPSSFSPNMKLLSHVRLFATLWTAVCQAPLFIGFSRQEYWNVLPCSPPGDLLDSGIEPRSPILQADSLFTELSGKHTCIHSPPSSPPVQAAT